MTITQALRTLNGNFRTNAGGWYLRPYNRHDSRSVRGPGGIHLYPWQAIEYAKRIGARRTRR
jgi:hypothetical protein